MTDTHADRRDARRRAKRQRIRKHGATLGQIYRNAIIKRQPKETR